jgi:NitT/TauT family transport system permease protein
MLFIIVCWYLIDNIFNLNDIIFPLPHQIIFALSNNIIYLSNNILITLFNALAGFLIGCIFSIITAIIITESKLIKNLIFPYILSIQAVPIISFAPLLILWFGDGYISKIIIAALISFFPILINMTKGLNSIEIDYLDLYKMKNKGKMKTLLELKFPFSLNYLFPSMKTSITYSLAGAVIAEFTGSSNGIGFVIINASYYMNTSLLLASLLMISFVGILLYYSIIFVERKIVFW